MGEKFSPPASDAEIAKIVRSGTPAGERLKKELQGTRDAFIRHRAKKTAIGKKAIAAKRAETATGLAEFRALGLGSPGTTAHEDRAKTHSKKGKPQFKSGGLAKRRRG